MSRDTIPGRLDTGALAALADDRQLYRPTAPGGRPLAVLELRRQGLKARDIAQALRLPLAEVLEVLRAERRASPPTRAPDYSRRAWVRYLAAQGCDYDEIAAALALDLAEVLQLLEPPEEAP